MRSPHKLLSPSTVTTENNQVFGFNAPSPLTVSSSSAAVTTLFYSPPSIPEQPEVEFTNGHTYNHTHNDVGGELEYQKKEVRFLSLFSTHSHYYFFFTLFFSEWYFKEDGFSCYQSLFVSHESKTISTHQSTISPQVVVTTAPPTSCFK